MSELPAPLTDPLPLARQADTLIRRAYEQLERVRTIEDARAVCGAASAVVEWLRTQRRVSLEVSNSAHLLKLSAEHRIGLFLYQPGTSLRGTVEETGLSHGEAARCRKIAILSAERLEEIAATATERGEILSRATVLRAAARQESREKTAEGPLPTPDPTGDAILTGDARVLAAQIPADSVELSVCDPVYDRVEDYEWLAAECARVLAPGGNLVVQCGNLRRFDCEAAMRRIPGLEFVDLLAEVYPYALCPLWPLRIQVGWKPHLWFTKGAARERSGEWVMNRLATSGKHRANGSKDLHPWGDGDEFVRGILEKLTQPGDLVWDPYCGSGLVPVLCRQLGRRFVASEIDPEAAALARERLSGTRPDPRGQLTITCTEEPCNE